MGQSFRFRSLAALLLSLGLAVSGCGPKGEGGDGGQQKPAAGGAGPIKVGAFLSMTGGTATFGQSSQKGMQLAIDEANAAGGVLGRQLQLIVEDDRSNQQEAKTAAIKLIQQDKVVAILGEVASSSSLAAAPDAQRSQIPMISPASTNAKVTEVGDYIFRVCFIDPFQGEVMAKFAFNSLKATKACLYKDNRSDYSVGLAEYFKNTFTTLGGQVLSEESYAAGDIDFKAQLTAIKGQNPDVIFIPGYYTEVGQIARQARELGITAVLLGGDGWDSPKTIEIGGAAVEGAYFSNHYSEEDPNPVVQGYIARFKAKYNEVPDAMGVLGFDAASVLINAMKTAGSTDGPALRGAIATTKEFPGVSGLITIDEKRNATKSAVVLKIEGGRLRYKETINP